MTVAKKQLAITWSKKKCTLNQIYSSGTEMCFISKAQEQVCDFFYCKDYLHDVIRSTLHEEDISIYGLSFTPANNPDLDLKCTRMAITNSQNPDFNNKISHVSDFINQIESELHLKKTCIYHIKNPKTKYKKCGMWIVEGSKKWMVSPPMISLYSLLLRCAFDHKRGNAWRRTVKDILNDRIKDSKCQKNDQNYLKRSIVVIEKIIDLGYTHIFHKEIKDNYPQDVGISNFHNHYGICSFSEKQPKQKMDHWYKLLDDTVTNAKE